jgi:hypothetical protein
MLSKAKKMPFSTTRSQLHEFLVLPRQQHLPSGHAGWAAGPHQPQLSEGQDQDGEADDGSGRDAKVPHADGVATTALTGPAGRAVRLA